MTNSNRKKIRGWKRRIQHIDKWFEKSKKYDLELFKSHGEDYTKIRIYPWNLLCERIPPNWYFRLIIGKLIAIYEIWKDKYERQKCPYDLQIWLNDPNTIRSQIVCAQVEKNGERRGNYYRKSKDHKEFPFTKWRSETYDLTKFEWELFDDEDLHYKNIEGLDNHEIDELLKEGFLVETVEIDKQEEIMYSRKVGHVWVGRLK